MTPQMIPKSTSTEWGEQPVEQADKVNLHLFPKLIMRYVGVFCGVLVSTTITLSIEQWASLNGLFSVQWLSDQRRHGIVGVEMMASAGTVTEV